MNPANSSRIEALLRLFLIIYGITVVVTFFLIDKESESVGRAVYLTGDRLDIHYWSSLVFGVTSIILGGFYNYIKAIVLKLFDQLSVDCESQNNAKIKLLLISAISLFLEIMVIRWMAVEVRIFAYFKNIVLLICFLGLGYGMLLKPAKKLSLVPSLMILFMLVLLAKTSFVFPGLSIENISYSIGFRWTEDALYRRSFGAVGGVIGQLISFGLVAIMLFMLFRIFVPLGQITGALFGLNKPITSYTLNISGAIIGILSFGVLSYFSLPPIVWFVCGLTAIVFVVRPSVFSYTFLASLIILFSLFLRDGLYEHKNSETFWSPYHKITAIPLYLSESEKPKKVGYDIFINNAGFQRPVNYTNAFLNDISIVDQEKIPLSRYNIIYQLKPAPKDVLIIGAGSGNDVAAALRGGAQSVVAVEIDPGIVEIGKNKHPEQPYSDPRVTVIIDDARAYLNRSNQKFDLIVFATLDSHTLASGYTNVQLDHYIYTQESFNSARNLLKDDGVFYMPFDSMSDWMISRFYSMLQTVFEESPIVFYSPEGVPWQWSKWVFIAGDNSTILETAAQDERLSPIINNSTSAVLELIQQDATSPLHVSTLTSDDWPYVYLKTRSIPPLYLAMTAFVLVALLAAFRKRIQVKGAFEYHFFFLGVGFLLLEFQALSRLSRIFGSTWIVSSVVILGVLVMILIANLLIAKYNIRFRKIYYLGLMLALLLSYFIASIPAGVFPTAAYAPIMTLITVLPVFFAALIFGSTFKEVNNQGFALGSNLIGSVVGGLLESASFIIGINAVVLLAMLIYFFAYLCKNRLSG